MLSRKIRELCYRRKAEGIGTGSGAIGGALWGARIGRHIGLVMGPHGAMVATIPCAIIGGLIFGLGGNKVGTELDRRSDGCVRRR